MTNAEDLKCAPTESADGRRETRDRRALRGVPRTVTVEAVKFAPTAPAADHSLSRHRARWTVNAEAVSFVSTECADGPVLGEEALAAAEVEAE